MAEAAGAVWEPLACGWVGGFWGLTGLWGLGTVDVNQVRETERNITYSGGVQRLSDLGEVKKKPVDRWLDRRGLTFPSGPLWGCVGCGRGVEVGVTPHEPV